MHDDLTPRSRLARLRAPAGDQVRDLAIAPWVIRLEGLSGAQAGEIDARFGGFVGPRRETAATATVSVVAGDGATWLAPWAPGEVYRIESDRSPGSPLVLSYHFALTAETPRSFKLVVEPSAVEPLGRILDNAARAITAHLALERGGFALHGATVRRDGLAWIFAGPSGSGKTTAVGLSSPAESMGDDFAVVLPDGAGWAAPAVPFDNAERAPRAPATGLVPLAGIWRLVKSERHAIERPSRAMAEASLLGCAAFPWALPELNARLAAAVGGVVASGRFAHLRFRRDAGFWPLLLAQTQG